MGAEKSTLRVIYFRHIRSILEFAVPVWNGAITQKEVKKNGEGPKSGTKYNLWK